MEARFNFGVSREKRVALFPVCGLSCGRLLHGEGSAFPGLQRHIPRMGQAGGTHMNTTQIQVRISPEVLAATAAAAKKKGLTPAMYLRLLLHDHLGDAVRIDEGEIKSYTIDVQNWQELEAYVREKCLGSVEVFAVFSMKQYLTKYPLTRAQNRRVEESTGEDDIPR
jgi:hypothetical protein